MKFNFDYLKGKKIGNTRIIPLISKIIFLFIIFILVSNISTNYINLSLNSSEMIKLTKELLIKDLKEIYNYCNNQYEIYDFNNDIDVTIKNIEKKAIIDFNKEKSKSIAIGVKENGNFLFQASNMKKQDIFNDKKILDEITKNRQKNINEGFITFKYGEKKFFYLFGGKYFGVYKYNPNWDVYIIRGEEYLEFYQNSILTISIILAIILIITLLCAVIGVYLIKYLLRFVNTISSEIMKMIEKQHLGIIDLKNASNDDITFLGVAFNSLSNSINNLMSIFLKFVNKDIAQKAYKEKNVKLEGTKKELTILFSDIKGFTFMTETLGIDIIKLLNLHYDNVINNILKHDGVIGSIIGDALLAVFGSIESEDENKSYQAIISAYDIQRVTEELRESMIKTKEKLEKNKKGLTTLEKKVFKAVLIEIGIGIDGGDVFYGTIGSSMRMTNTVIGDNVNFASRLESLTRIYNIPVICSEYIKNDIENNRPDHNLRFVEIDTVKVKGKTKGQKIFWPLFENEISAELNKNIKIFNEGIVLYYQGKWQGAVKIFKKCKLPFIDIFIERTLKNKLPKNWNGIWIMENK